MAHREESASEENKAEREQGKVSETEQEWKTLAKGSEGDANKTTYAALLRQVKEHLELMELGEI